MRRSRTPSNEKRAKRVFLREAAPRACLVSYKVFMRLCRTLDDEMAYRLSAIGYLHTGMVPPAGHDPATVRLRVACAAHLRHDGILVPTRGLEPLSPRLKGVCVAFTPRRHIELVLSAGFEPALARV